MIRHYGFDGQPDPRSGILLGSRCYFANQFVGKSSYLHAVRCVSETGMYISLEIKAFCIRTLTDTNFR